MTGIVVDWQQLLLWASLLSVGALVGSAVGIPWIITRLPQDYFLREERVVWRAPRRNPLMGICIAIVKNVAGLLLVALGIVMLVTPGQGLLTLLAGLLLMNFPGKYRLERWLISRPGVMRGMNWLRRRQHKMPFDVPTAHTRDD